MLTLTSGDSVTAFSLSWDLTLKVCCFLSCNKPSVNKKAFPKRFFNNLWCRALSKVFWKSTCALSAGSPLFTFILTPLWAIARLVEWDPFLHKLLFPTLLSKIQTHCFYPCISSLSQLLLLMVVIHLHTFRLRWIPFGPGHMNNQLLYFLPSCNPLTFSVSNIVSYLIKSLSVSWEGRLTQMLQTL